MSIDHKKEHILNSHEITYSYKFVPAKINLKKNNELNKFKMEDDFKNAKWNMTSEISIKEVQESDVWRV